VVSIDRFGNLVTSIGQDRLASFLKDRQADAACFVVGGYRIDGLSASYDSVYKDQPLAIIGSRGVVEIAVNRESAQDRMEAAIGDAVRVMAGGHGSERGGRQ
jgi:S-adenosylmethionine hydrolase